MALKEVFNTANQQGSVEASTDALSYLCLRNPMVRGGSVRMLAPGTLRCGAVRFETVRCCAVW